MMPHNEQFIARAIRSAREKRPAKYPQGGAEVLQVRAEDGGGFERPWNNSLFPNNDPLWIHLFA